MITIKNVTNDPEKEHVKDIIIFLKKKKIKGKKRKDIKILLKKENKKGVSIIKNLKRSYLTIEDIII